MEYSDTIKRLIKDYNLTPQDALFSILAASGISRPEAYLHIYFPSIKAEASIKAGAAKLVKDKPQIIKLINDLKTQNKIIPLSADPTNKQSSADLDKAKAEGWRPSETPEQNLKRITEKNLWKLEPKEKIDAARNLAKLYGVKEDQRETRHYYLPLSCKHCNLYIEAEDKARRKKGTE